MHILIVEDDRKVAAFMTQGLQEDGHVVEVAEDGVTALALALEGDFAVIILDYMLPRMTGVEVAAELRRQGRRTPILLLTALDSKQAIDSGFAAGVDDYLGKPFRFDELIRRVETLASGSDASR